MAVCHALLCSQHPRPLENEQWPLVAVATPHIASQRRPLRSRPMTSHILLLTAVPMEIPEGTYTSHSYLTSVICLQEPTALMPSNTRSNVWLQNTFVLLFYGDILIWFWENPWEHRRQCCNFPQMGLKHISFPSKSSDSLIEKWSLCSPTPTAVTSTIPSRMEITPKHCHCMPGNLIPPSFLSRTELNCCHLALGIEKPGSSAVPGVVNCKNHLIRQK